MERIGITTERERSGERPWKKIAERERSGERTVGERERSGERDSIKIALSDERQYGRSRSAPMLCSYS
jgi:hypothetical protein